MKTCFISVGGFNIRLEGEDKKLIAIEDGYLTFKSPKKWATADVVVSSYACIPIALLSETELLFEAKNDEKKFFSIYRYDQSYKFIIYDQNQENVIQQVAILDNNLCNWEVYSSHTNEKGETLPLLYPLGPIILYYLTLKSDAVLIHASGIFDKKKGRLFTGFSGAGKSTMAYLWQKSGAKIINDDRLIIRKEKGQYVMYNTPMYYVDIPKKAALDSIYLIKHAKTNGLKKISGVAAVSQLTAFIIQHNFNSNFIDHHLLFITELCSSIPVYETGFIPDSTIVEHIKNNEL